ncbi:MAG: insulinase family protein, partial [bacterium]
MSFRSRKSFIFLLPIIGNLLATPLFRDSLSNGLVILTYEDNRLPIIDISFVCRSGALFDPEGKAGTAGLCAEMLFRGTKNLSADSIAQILDFMGAQYRAGVDFDHCYL